MRPDGLDDFFFDGGMSDCVATDIAKMSEADISSEFHHEGREMRLTCYNRPHHTAYDYIPRPLMKAYRTLHQVWSNEDELQHTIILTRATFPLLTLHQRIKLLRTITRMPYRRLHKLRALLAPEGAACWDGTRYHRNQLKVFAIDNGALATSITGRYA